MTITPTRPQPPEADRTEVLIKEARRFQHRRWWIRGTLTLAIVLLVVTTVLVTSGHGGTPTILRPGPFRPARAPAAPVGRGPSLGPATAAVLTGPGSLAVDRADDVFFTDGSRIYEVDHATGQILVVAGTGVNGYSGDGGPATEADLSLPGGIALAPNGDLYVVDELRIRKISAATGIITTVAGTGQVGDTGNGGPAVRADLDLVTGPAGTLGLDGPIAVGPNGDLYIADGGNDEVRRVSAATGIITTVAGDGVAGSSGDGGPATKAEICQPEGIVVDRSDDLFITTACDAIRQVSARNGLISTVFRVHQAPALAGEGTPYRPVGLGLAADGRLLVIGFSSRRILELAPTSDTVVLAAGTGYQTVPTAGATAGDGGPASAATFGLIDAVTMDAQGDIYVADFFNNAIREIDPRTGLITLLAGQIPQSPAAGHCC